MGIFNWFMRKSVHPVNDPTGLHIANQAQIDDTSLGVVYTCCSRLSDNFSRMPIEIKVEDSGKVIENHRLHKLLRYKPNNYQNAQVFWSTLEYHRSLYGNAFARIIRNTSTGVVKYLEILHPQSFVDYQFSGGNLYYKFDLTLNPNSEESGSLTVNFDDILHFKHISFDGVLGLSPLKAAQLMTRLNGHAAQSVGNLYAQGALTPMVVEDSPSIGPRPSGGAKNKDNLEDLKNTFEGNYSKAVNAGKVPFLPPGKALKQIIIDYSKMELISSLKFSRDEIANIYHVPQWMVSDNDTTVSDIEQQSTAFVNYTIAPIAAAYEAELENKLLTDNELGKVSIEFSADALIKLDIKTKVTAIRDQVTAGLLSPNEATKKLGNNPIDAPWAKKHFIQKQNIPLEDYDEYSLKLDVEPKNSKRE
jgi:HK97 family phage portal protein